MKTKYRLFAMRPTAENQEKAAGMRFARMTQGYILVYTAGEAPAQSVELAGENLRRMTAADEEWLIRCNATLIQEETEAHRDEIRAAVSAKIARLERELAAEAAREETEHEKQPE